MKSNLAALTLIALLSLHIALSNILPAFAWNFSVNAEPEIRYAFPGQTVTYTVYVNLVTAPASTVSLLITPWSPELNGFSFTFYPSATGTPTFTRLLSVTISSGKAPGTYYIPVAGFSATATPYGYRTDHVQLVVLAAAPVTDWALSNPTMNPSSPKIGDPTTFSVVLRALSTNAPYPQSVRVAAILDGALLGSGTLSYPGPTGVLMTVNLATPWIATEGPHTILWVADPSPYSYEDPYRYNNEATLSFTVAAAPPPFDFFISASPPKQKVTAGGSTSYVIIVSLVSGTTQPVSLSLTGLPSGVTHSFNPPSSAPTFQSTLDIHATKATAAGTYSLSLTASGGGTTKTASLTLEVEAAPEEDFSIVVTPTSSEIQQGEITTHTVTLNSLAGFNAAVDLSISGLPAQATASFGQAKITPSGTTTLTIRTTRRTPTGAYVITVVASGGGKTHDATIALNVKEAKPLSLFEMLAEYGMIIIGLLGALVLALIVLVLFLVLRRRPSRPSPAPSTSPPSEVFCSSCGAKLASDAAFCPKCGAKRSGA